MTPILIAITGGSGSGKSTLAHSLLTALGAEHCTLIGEDNYYKPRAQQAEGAENWSVDEVEQRINFDAADSKDMIALANDVSALKEARPILQPVYEFACHDRRDGETLRIEPAPYVIVEGIHVLSDTDLADLFDLTIYVDTPDDLRLARRISRDIVPKEQGGRGRSPERVIAQYLNFVRASHYRFTEPAKYICDLVIADEGLPAYGSAEPSKEAIDRMLSPVMSRLAMMGDG